ncbi:helix-turn-helix domain-containing protein [Albimonas pacifica]|uniref:helix-turn-helix domain-containing protein n=1 Tax=Albimonas pacifica TaxID=1114924 RepID=UPI0015A67FDF|nr:helix-turn-helix transcriptional regulator [Albimonas pacifica]
MLLDIRVFTKTQSQINKWGQRVRSCKCNGMQREPEMQILTDNIAALLAERGWTKKDLSRAAGFTERSTRVYELFGDRVAHCRVDTVAACARALGVSVANLFQTPEHRALEHTFLRLLEQLPPDEKDRLIRIAEALAASNDAPPTRAQ